MSASVHGIIQTSVSISPPPITGSYSEEGVDEDGNNLIESIKITAGAYIAEEGNYAVHSELYDTYDQRVDFIKKELFLKEGQQNVQIEFPAKEIYASKISGPYEIRYIEIRKDDKIIDSVYKPLVTKEYYYDKFERNLIDLAILDIKKTDNTVTVKVKNLGTDYAFAPLVSFFDQDFNLIGERIIDYLGPREVKERTITLDEGISEVTAIVDYENEIDEKTKENNMAKIEI